MKKFVLIYLEKLYSNYLPCITEQILFVVMKIQKDFLRMYVRIQISKIHINFQINNSKSVDLSVFALRLLVLSVSSILKYASK